MTWDGMLPPHDCEKCGNPLDTSGNRPAERYLGTYTGICYTCQNLGPYTLKIEFDGAHIISYPPHCPAWRRDRQTFTAYMDCEKCKGKGRFLKHRTIGGDSYPVNCEDCQKRYSEHPKRRWSFHKMYNLRIRANNVFTKELKKRKLLKKGQIIATGEVVENIRDGILKRYEHAKDRANKLIAQRLTYVTINKI